MSEIYAVIKNETFTAKKLEEDIVSYFFFMSTMGLPKKIYVYHTLKSTSVASVVLDIFLTMSAKGLMINLQFFLTFQYYLFGINTNAKG